ncbi:MAG TPA: Uma2 family endonuclease [Kofleriaceae bacterium]|nr:Uma2 family endonuclease [Kofleriaceae bacterium]
MMNAVRRATYQDVLDAPEHEVAELIDGTLYLSPRPAKPHARAASRLGGELFPPFDRGRNGPGGWFLLFEPELHVGADVLVPDLAGWRRERMPVLTTEEAYFTLAPDWVCEVLSPSTAKLDRELKLPIYARAEVQHAWLIDPVLHTLEVLRLERGRWAPRGTYRDDARVRAEPFEALELELAVLWAGVQLAQ